MGADWPPAAVVPSHLLQAVLLGAVLVLQPAPVGRGLLQLLSEPLQLLLQGAERTSSGLLALHLLQLLLQLVHLGAEAGVHGQQLLVLRLQLFGLQAETDTRSEL